MFNKSVHLTNGLMTPRLAVHILPIPVETITSPIMEAYALDVIITDVPIRVKSCFFLCRFVNHMLHKREKERAPHEGTSSLRDA